MKSSTALIAAVLAFVIAIPLFLVIMLSVLFADEESSASCNPTHGSTGGGSGVPAGSLSKVMKDGTYTLTSPFGQRWGSMHRGIDLAGPDGTPIYALADGVVAEAGPAGGFGQWIIIDHLIGGEKVSTVYGHMWPKGVLVSTGDEVKAGQHIADVGNNGESTGPHLHFETWQGGRLTGGTEMDPTPLLDSAVEPGAAGAGPAPAPPANKPAAPRPPSGDLPDLASYGLGGEGGFQRDTVRLARVIAAEFGDRLNTIGGYRPPSGNGLDDHVHGLAIDIMIPNYASAEGIALGEEILAYILANETELNVKYQIWRSQYYHVGTPPTPYTQGADSGDTQQHRDHIHVTTNGGGFPEGSESYAAGPAAGSRPSTKCLPGHSLADEELNEGEVPEIARKWVVLAGRLCPAVNAPLIAGLIEQESSWGANASSGKANGWSQFIPSTWAAYGAKVGEDGQPIGPPGSGSTSDPGDSIMAGGRYLCIIADEQAPLIASGAIQGDPTQLMLAGYNAGPGAVVQYGGVPPFAETEAYVVEVPQKALKYTKGLEK